MQAAIRESMTTTSPEAPEAKAPEAADADGKFEEKTAGELASLEAIAEVSFCARPPVLPPTCVSRPVYVFFR